MERGGRERSFMDCVRDSSESFHVSFEEYTQNDDEYLWTELVVNAIICDIELESNC